jgi:transposase-like protein
MICTANIQLQLGPQLHSTQYRWPHENLELDIPVKCPHCRGNTEAISTWGSYPTSTGEVRRYRCKTCWRTFNPAKIPYWRDKVGVFVWKLTQMVIKDRVAINALAKMWGVPETTLRTLTSAVKDFLATNLEIIKQLQERLSVPDTVKLSPLRVIFYDEGFIKLLGANGFILFTLTMDGTPINVAIEPQRDTQTIHGYFVQAMTQLGGIDVIVSDGGKAILAAAKALRQPLILVQHIHQGKGKRARIIKLEPIPNRKALWEITVELHTGSLLANTESKIMARTKKVYPAKWASPTPRKKRDIKQKLSQKDSIKRTGVLTPVEGVGSSKKARPRNTSFLKGHAIALRTGANPCEYELGYIPSESDFTATDCPSLTQLQAMFGVVQQTLPKQFISSNRAETFNALHDRYNVYWGRKSLLHANRDVRAWTAVTFFPEGCRVLLQRHKWHVPYRLLVHFLPLMISKVRMR